MLEVHVYHSVPPGFKPNIFRLRVRLKQLYPWIHTRSFIYNYLDPDTILHRFFRIDYCGHKLVAPVRTYTGTQVQCCVAIIVIPTVFHPRLDILDPYSYPYPWYPYPWSRTRTHAHIYALVPVPVPMTLSHVEPVPIPIPMVSYPYPYPWSRTRTHTHGLVPIPVPTLQFNICGTPNLLFHAISC